MSTGRAASSGAQLLVPPVHARHLPHPEVSTVDASLSSRQESA